MVVTTLDNLFEVFKMSRLIQSLQPQNILDWSLDDVVNSSGLATSKD
jgi:hypothetical protein